MFPASSAHLTCLCGTVSTPGSILSNLELPIYTEICHCNSCRHTTGSLGVSFPALKSAPSQAIISQVTEYKSSAILSRYFCSKCGCHCFSFNHDKEQWLCLGGIIEPSPITNVYHIPPPTDITKVLQQNYILDTIDGGLAPLLINLNRRFIPIWSGPPQKHPKQGISDLTQPNILSLLKMSIRTIPQPKAESFLSAKCHCGGISLLIKRANYGSDANSNNQSRHVPSDSTKYLTYLCACRSCRLSTGVSLVPWTLIPPANVFAAPKTVDGKLVPVVFGQSVSNPNVNSGLTLRHYWSSPDVCRSFCCICGATVSYWCARRPDELDLAVGILRSEEGCMARRWLDWEWGRCSFTSECIDSEMCEAWLRSAEVMNEVGG